VHIVMSVLVGTLHGTPLFSVGVHIVMSVLVGTLRGTPLFSVGVHIVMSVLIRHQSHWSIRNQNNSCCEQFEFSSLLTLL